MTGSLFGDPAPFDPPERTDAPLPERLRPKSLDEVVGLEDLLGEGRAKNYELWGFFILTPHLHPRTSLS